MKLEDAPNIHFKIICISLIALLLTGCVAMFAPNGHAKPHSELLGRLNLSLKGAECESHFVWPYGNPQLTFRLSDTNKHKVLLDTTPQKPNWPLAIQADVTEKKTGRIVVSSTFTKENIWFGNLPTPSLGISLFKWKGILKEGRSYNCVVRILKEAEASGNAGVYLDWIEGADSM